MITADIPAFYRVSVKALIFDSEQRLLVFQDKNGDWEIPGGGLEHGESLEEGLTRELHEEMRLEPEHIGGIRFIYSSPNEKGIWKLRIAVDVTVTHHNFEPSDDDLVGARFITPAEFLELPFQGSEKAIVYYADQIWL